MLPQVLPNAMIHFLIFLLSYSRSIRYLALHNQHPYTTMYAPHTLLSGTIGLASSFPSWCGNIMPAILFTRIALAACSLAFDLLLSCF